MEMGTEMSGTRRHIEIDWGECYVADFVIVNRRAELFVWTFIFR